MRLAADLVLELEQEIARLPNVSFCSIHLDPRGEVDSIDVVSDRGRNPQRIVRDVEILLRRHGLDIDHRKIGVAQLARPGGVAPSRDRHRGSPERNPQSDGESAGLNAVLQLVPEPERLVVLAVHTSDRGGGFSAEVELARGPLEGLPGRAQGPGQDPVACVGVVAQATLEAVRNLLHPGYEARLREVRILDMGAEPMVVLTVDFGRGRQLHRLAGACLQRGSLYETAVYATLDAVNRPLGRAGFRRLALLEGSGEPEDGDLDAAFA